MQRQAAEPAFGICGRPPRAPQRAPVPLALHLPVQETVQETVQAPLQPALASLAELSDDLARAAHGVHQTHGLTGIEDVFAEIAALAPEPVASLA